MAKKLCIMMHGYGADANDLQGLIPVLSDHTNDVDYLSIEAPFVCEPYGVGRQWYPLGPTTIPLTANSKVENFMKKDILTSMQYIKEIIKSELQQRNLTNKDLILLGFSQGAFMALNYTLYNAEKDAPAKCIALSGFIENKKPTSTKSEFLICHGENDDVVHPSAFNLIVEMLNENGIKNTAVLSKHTGHSISQQAVEAVIKFLK